MKCLTIALTLASLSPSLIAQGTPGPSVQRGLASTRLAVVAKIESGVATTRITQTIHNHGRRNAEATWIIPLPEGAVADGFTMTVGGKVMRGEVFNAKGARDVYERIVRQQRDPGLLEYFGSGCLRACVYPIPPQQDLEVEVTYRQVLPQIGGIHSWRFPLDAVGITSVRAEQITLDVTLESQKPIRNVFSPVPGLHIAQKDDHHARISLETKTPPRGGIELFYGLSENEFGLNLMTWRKADEAGYFMLMISPKREWADAEVMGKSVTFVIDTSGSMKGKKIQQARAALVFFLQSLRPADTFNVVTFSTDAQPFFDRARTATPTNLESALQKCKAIIASGGTNIDDALTRGVTRNEDDGRVPLTVFLTDGLPTIGKTSIDGLVQTAKTANLANGRIFVFGVGNDINTHLLDRIAADSGGTRNYVREDEDIEQKTGDLFTKLSHPVMTDLELHLDGIGAQRLVPSRLPHLYRGDRLIVVGRYTGSGPHPIRLCGKVGGVMREYCYAANFAKTATRHDFVPSLWAHRRTGVLLDAIRLNGRDKELIDEVKRLGTAFKIVTPYTSHLILEQGLGRDTLGNAPKTYRGPAGRRSGGAGAPGGGRTPGSGGPRTPGPTGPATPGPTGPTTPGPRGPGPSGPTTGGGGFVGPSSPIASHARLVERLRKAGVLPKDAPKAELEQLARDVSRELQRSMGGLKSLGIARSGKQAVDDSAFLAEFSNSVTTASDDFFMGAGMKRKTRLADMFVRRVKQRIFVLRLGVWTDSGFEASRVEQEGWPRVEVTAYSKAYFALLRTVPTLRPYFAFSDRLLVVLDKKVYLVKAAPQAAPSKRVNQVK